MYIVCESLCRYSSVKVYIYIYIVDRGESDRRAI